MKSNNENQNKIIMAKLMNSADDKNGHKMFGK